VSRAAWYCSGGMVLIETDGSCLRSRLSPTNSSAGCF
jgi:hypothetical protein